jgi:hypothetical protein
VAAPVPAAVSVATAATTRKLKKSSRDVHRVS